MDDNKIIMVAEEASRILKENPYLKYRKAIDLAKEVVCGGYNGMSKDS